MYNSINSITFTELELAIKLRKFNLIPGLLEEACPSHELTHTVIDLIVELFSQKNESVLSLFAKYFSFNKHQSEFCRFSYLDVYLISKVIKLNPYKFLSQLYGHYKKIDFEDRSKAGIKDLLCKCIANGAYETFELIFDRVEISFEQLSSLLEHIYLNGISESHHKITRKLIKSFLLHERQNKNTQEDVERLQNTLTKAATYLFNDDSTAYHELLKGSANTHVGNFLENILITLAFKFSKMKIISGYFDTKYYEKSYIARLCDNYIHWDLSLKTKDGFKYFLSLYDYKNGALNKRYMNFILESQDVSLYKCFNYYYNMANEYSPFILTSIDDYISRVQTGEMFDVLYWNHFKSIDECTDAQYLKVLISAFRLGRYDISDDITKILVNRGASNLVTMLYEFIVSITRLNKPYEEFLSLIHRACSTIPDQICSKIFKSSGLLKQAVLNNNHSFVKWLLVDDISKEELLNVIGLFFVNSRILPSIIDEVLYYVYSKKIEISQEWHKSRSSNMTDAFRNWLNNLQTDKLFIFSSYDLFKLEPLFIPNKFPLMDVTIDDGVYFTHFAMTKLRLFHECLERNYLVNYTQKSIHSEPFEKFIEQLRSAHERLYNDFEMKMKKVLPSSANQTNPSFEHVSEVFFRVAKYKAPQVGDRLEGLDNFEKLTEEKDPEPNQLSLYKNLPS